MRNLVTSYRSATREEMEVLGSKVLSGNLGRVEYRRVLAIIAGGNTCHRYHPDAVLEMLFVMKGNVSSFDMNMLRVAIHKHQDVLLPLCEGMKSWEEMFVMYPGTLSLDNVDEERTKRIGTWKARIAEYHALRRGGRASVR